MEKLIELLNENMERLNSTVWAEWLSEEQEETPDLREMMRQLNILDELECLLIDDRVNLVVDDRALIISLKNN